MDAHRIEFPIAAMRRVLHVSSSGYYAWRGREPSARQQKRLALIDQIRMIHAASHGNYGSPKIHRHLLKQGQKCNVKTVANCMKSAGICSKVTKKHRICTTDSNHALPIAENLLNRDFTATKPGEKLVADITYVKTDEGWLFLAVVIDLFSRMVIGWSMSASMKASLVIGALQMAMQQCQLEPGCIMHSDRGSQYASREHRDLLEQHGLICSMSRTGNCWDNAVAESFFATMKKELVYHEHYTSHEQARGSLFEFIEIYYNRWRTHSAIDYRTPDQRQNIAS
jgi:transposase InsO family protein